MSKKENEMSDDKRSSIERLAEAGREDQLGSLDNLVPTAIPPGVDRRTFLMRSAVVGATAVITGSHLSAQGRTQKATGTPPKLDPNLNVVKKEKGAGDDDSGRVLQSGTGPLKFAHDRSDAHYLRFLPAMHQAAGGPTQPGNGAQGPSVR